MRRASTPVHTFEVPLDLRRATVFISYAQGNTIVLEKTGKDLTINEKEISCKLTQAETLKFKEGTVQMQIRYVLEDGTADASSIMRIDAEKILKDGEITYEG